MTVYVFALMLFTWVLAFALQCVAYLPCRLLLDKYQRAMVLGHIFRKVSCLVIWLNPLWSVKRHGTLSAQPKRAIVMCNHLSNCDPWMTAAGLFPYETKYISKGSLFKVPFGGWAMSMGGDVPVHFTKEKGGWGTVKGSIGKMMSVVKDLIDHNVPVTVFPEGARSRTGRMQTFKDGFFQFAAEHDVPIIPVALNGSQNGWLPGDWKLDFTTVHFTVGTAISGEKDAAALRERVKAEIVRLYNTLPGADPDYPIPHPDDVAAEAARAEKARKMEAAVKDAADSAPKPPSA